MADISTNMSVKGLSEYKKAMKDAAASVKPLDAELKLNEATYKATGNSATYMSNKVGLLKAQIEQQTKVVQNAEAALKEMEKGGNKSGTAYENMRRQLTNATTSLWNMRAELQNVESGAKSADTELGKIGKGVNWENVTSGIKDITEQLRNGAKAALDFGKRIARSAMDSTSWADDIITRSKQYGVDTETLQKMDRVAEFIDTDVDTIIDAKDRMSKNRESLSDLLGISSDGRPVDDVFWEAGKAIMNLGDGFDKADYAQKIFGRSWRELLPLFSAGREEYDALMNSQNVLTDEQVQKLGAADDAFKSVQQQAEMLKNQFWADNADKITGLLQWLIDNKDGVVVALTAIGGAFGAIKIGEFALNLGKVINGFKSFGFFGGGNSGASAAQAASTGATAGGGGLMTWAKNGLLAGLKAAGPTLGVTAAALLPAWLAMNDTWNQSEAQRQARIGAVGTSESVNAQFVRRAAEAVTIRNGQNADFGAIEELLMGLSSRQNQQKAELYNVLKNAAPTQGSNTWGLLNRLWGGEAMDMGTMHEMLENITDAFASAESKVQVPVEPAVEDGAAEAISKEIGTVPVTVTPQIGGLIGMFLGGGSHANGLPWVPYDGYLSVLHRGERVMTASENRNYTYNNNTYFGNVNLNNGLEVDALTESIARNNRRKNSGYGA
jgi:hypothetical protein